MNVPKLNRMKPKLILSTKNVFDEPYGVCMNHSHVSISRNSRPLS